MKVDLFRAASCIYSTFRQAQSISYPTKILANNTV